ncbi:MAG: HAMP domain-containing protein, partial [Desulfobacterales bacterium]|nr:HAMP domain-containing protein [Desulfobacterales bacterium]
MKGTLWTKLALSYVAIALTAVALSAFLFNFFLSKKFRGYVEETQRIKDEQMVILLGSIYENDGKWDPARIQDVLNMGMMSGKKITILDSEGRRVTDCCASTRKMGLDAQKKISGMMKMCGWDSEQLQLKPIQATSENWPFTTPAPDLPELKGREVPVFVGKRQVGTAVINPLGNRGAFSVQDRSFQKTVNRWLWGAALGAGGFALIMSLGMARRLSRPLRALSRAAQQLKDGDLTQQVEPEGKDE